MCVIHGSIWFRVNGIYGSVDKSERMSLCARSHNRLHKNKEVVNVEFAHR